MKKTERNQNMTDQQANDLHQQKKNEMKGKPERFTDQNLNQPQNKNNHQRYDDRTGTVENGLG